MNICMNLYETTHHFNKYIRVIVPDWPSPLIEKKVYVSEDLHVILILKRFREGQSRHLGGGGQSRDIFRGASEKNTLYEHV